MTFDASVTLAWGGDERRFRLGIDELLALQERRRSGPLEILSRLQAGLWRVEDVQETLRIGLIGGGAEAKVARELVDRHVREGRVIANVTIAQAVLLNALLGDPDETDQPGKQGSSLDARLSAASFYRNGAAMGFTPQEVGKMSVWQFAACVDGFNRANSPDGPVEAPTADEFAAAKAVHGDDD